MGKVIKMLENIRSKDNMELLERFKHITKAHAIREYLASKRDTILEVEINLVEEEIIKRMGYFLKCPKIIELSSKQENL